MQESGSDDDQTSQAGEKDLGEGEGLVLKAVSLPNNSR